MKHIKLTGQVKKKQSGDKQVSRNLDGIEPFSERPTIEPADDQQKRVSAHDLFSLFTANIIREKTIFTR